MLGAGAGCRKQRDIPAIVLRGRLRLDQMRSVRTKGTDTKRLTAEQAMDDAHTAHTMAQRCGYLWAERDTASLDADANSVLGNAERAREARREADQLARHLQPTI
jgi:hypothetical protein